MKVRILNEGRFDVPDSYMQTIERLDASLEQSISKNDEEAFKESLELLIKEIKTVGNKLPDDDLSPSDLVVPASGSTIQEVRELLESDR
jgi:hypothetical protein